ncbi:unnamed protein product, partial [Prorocentrum cordatum]
RAPAVDCRTEQPQQPETPQLFQAVLEAKPKASAGAEGPRNVGSVGIYVLVANAEGSASVLARRRGQNVGSRLEIAAPGGMVERGGMGDGASDGAARFAACRGLAGESGLE